jgi:hypothetical protein
MVHEIKEGGGDEDGVHGGIENDKYDAGRPQGYPDGSSNDHQEEETDKQGFHSLSFSQS